MLDRLQTLIESRAFGGFVMFVIIFNAVLLGLDTSATVVAAVGPVIHALDTLCLAIFVGELVVKFIVYRWRFFASGWNLFDLLIVGLSMVPGIQSLSALRALRILRVLRLVSVVPRLRRVVEGLINALPGMASVFLLMTLVFYIGAVIATKLFGGAFPEWFGTLGRSGYSLFQIMTLESWSMGIVRPVMEIYPLAWAFFVPFILVTSFAVVNLLVGLIVNSMQDAHSEETNAETDAYRDDVAARLQVIEGQLERLLEEKGKG